MSTDLTTVAVIPGGTALLPAKPGDVINVTATLGTLAGEADLLPPAGGRALKVSITLGPLRTTGTFRAPDRLTTGQWTLKVGVRNLLGTESDAELPFHVTRPVPVVTANPGATSATPAMPGTKITVLCVNGTLTGAAALIGSAGAPTQLTLVLGAGRASGTFMLPLSAAAESSWTLRVETLAPGRSSYVAEAELHTQRIPCTEAESRSLLEAKAWSLLEDLFTAADDAAGKLLVMPAGAPAGITLKAGRGNSPAAAALLKQAGAIKFRVRAEGRADIDRKALVRFPGGGETSSGEFFDAHQLLSSLHGGDAKLQIFLPPAYVDNFDAAPPGFSDVSAAALLAKDTYWPPIDPFAVDKLTGPLSDKASDWKLYLDVRVALWEACTLEFTVLGPITVKQLNLLVPTAAVFFAEKDFGGGAAVAVHPASPLNRPGLNLVPFGLSQASTPDLYLLLRNFMLVVNFLTSNQLAPPKANTGGDWDALAQRLGDARGGVFVGQDLDFLRAPFFPRSVALLSANTSVRLTFFNTAPDNYWLLPIWCWCWIRLGRPDDNLLGVARSFEAVKDGADPAALPSAVREHRSCSTGWHDRTRFADCWCHVVYGRWGIVDANHP